MNVLSLCSGAGGLELGLELAVPSSAAVAYVERDAAALEVLAARMADGSLAPAPVFLDLVAFDARPLAGLVDVVAAGFPCQPHSVAGKRGGVADERWLWDEVWRVVREVRAPLLFVENVPGLLTSGGFDRVLADLAASGWAAEWDCVPAASVGAPHARDRIFLLAADPDGAALRLGAERDQRRGRRVRAAECGYADPLDVGGEGDAPDPDDSTGRAEPRLEQDQRPDFVVRSRGPSAAGPGIEASDATPADATCDGREDVSARRAAGRRAAGRGGRRIDPAQTAYSGRAGLEVALGVGADEVARWREAAGRDGERWAGRPPPEPCLRGVDDGLARTLDRDRLFVLGNGVVPQAAARAWRTLWGRLSEVMP